MHLSASCPLCCKLLTTGCTASHRSTGFCITGSISAYSAYLALENSTAVERVQALLNHRTCAKRSCCCKCQYIWIMERASLIFWTLTWMLVGCRTTSLKRKTTGEIEPPTEHEPMTCALSRSFSHAHYGISHTPLSPIALTSLLNDWPLLRSGHGSRQETWSNPGPASCRWDDLSYK